MSRPISKLFIGSLFVGASILLLRSGADLPGKIRQGNGPIGLELAGGQTYTMDRDHEIVGNITLSDDAVLTVKSVTRVRPLPGEDRVYVRLRGRAKLIIADGAVVPFVSAPESLIVEATDDSQILIDNGVLLTHVSLDKNAKITGVNATLSTIVGPAKIDPALGAYGNLELAGNARAEFTTSVLGGITLDFDAKQEADLSGLNPQKYTEFDLRTVARHYTAGMDVILRRTTVLGESTEHWSDAGWSIAAHPQARVRVHTSDLHRVVIGPFENEKVTFHKFPIGKRVNLAFRGIQLDDSSVTGAWGFTGRDSSLTFRESEGLWLQPWNTGTWSVEGGSVTRIDATEFIGDVQFKKGTWTDGGRFLKSDLRMRGDIAIGERVKDQLTLKNSTVSREYTVAGFDPRTSVSLQVFDGTALVAGAQRPLKEFALPIIFTDDNAYRALSAQASIAGKTSLTELRLTSSTPLTLR